jgi:hypothetical protein
VQAVAKKSAPSNFVCPDPEAAKSCKSFQELREAGDGIPVLDNGIVYVCFRQPEDAFFIVALTGPDFKMPLEAPAGVSTRDATPACAPQANAFCERVIGTIRCERLDFMIPMSERHVRAILREWVRHYNRGRPHASLGPGIPDRPVNESLEGLPDRRLPTGCRVTAAPILGGLHHEYSLAREAA